MEWVNEFLKIVCAEATNLFESFLDLDLISDWELEILFLDFDLSTFF